MPILQELPNVKVKPDKLKQLADTLRFDLDRHTRGTKELHTRMMTWLDLYEGRAPIKNRPYQNASNLIMPFATINVDTTKAQIKQAIKAATKQWVGTITEIAKTPEEVEEAEIDWPATRDDFVNFAEWVTGASPHFDWDEFLDDWTDEFTKFGTAFTKTFYNLDRVPAKVFNPRTGLIEKTERVKIDGPVVEVIPLDRCVWNLGIARLSEAWLFGHWFEITANQLKSRITSHNYNKRAVNRLLKSGGETTELESERHKDEKEGIRRSPSDESKEHFRLYQLYVDFDIDDDGFEEALLVDFEPRTGEIVRLIFQPTVESPFDRAVFEPRGRRLLGRGAIEPLEHMIRGASTVANQTIDAQHLANSNCVTGPSDSEAEVVMEDGIQPGTFIPVASKEEADMIREFSLGNPGAIVSLELLERFQSFIERLGHIGDPQTGAATGRRTPVGTAQSFLQESSRLIDEVIARLGPIAGRIMFKIIELHFQRDPEIFRQVLGNAAGDRIIKAFNARTNVSEFLKITLNAQSASNSKQIETQNLMAFSQFVLSYSQQIMQLAEPFTNPQVPDTWRRIAVETIRAMEVTLKKMAVKFQQDEPAKQIPQLVAIFSQVAAEIQQSRQGAGQLGPGGQGDGGAPPFQPDQDGGGPPGV